MQFQFTGFNFRKIQNVIDDFHQWIRRLVDGIHVFFLNTFEFGIHQKLGKTNDAV